MKLTMKNNYSFQKVIGYPDDPEIMSTDDVKEALANWSKIIGLLLMGEKPPLDYIAGLDGLLSALADGEVEYEEPLKTYGYHAGFEYYDNFEVIAESQEQADEAALKLFESMAADMPAKINDAKGCFKYLEQYDPNYGSDKRIYED